MPSSCTVLIGAPGLADRLDLAVDAGRELLTFSDHESLAALDSIVERRPGIVALDRMFASSSRGAALINRVSVNPDLSHTQVWTVGADTPPVRLTLSRPWPAGPILDYRGTRRAPRVRMHAGVDLQVDGTSAQLVDLSVFGAQVLSPAVLKPNQRVRLVLPVASGVARTLAIVAWALFELPKGQAQPRYRAGLEFKDADATAIEDLCASHGLVGDGLPTRS